MLRDFIIAGCSVLLSDVDVVRLQNPFTHPNPNPNLGPNPGPHADPHPNPHPDPHPNPNQVWMQNPFTLPSLYRDVDVEGMTDGWDDPSAFGYPWKDGQAKQQLRLSARNSGLFFIAATDEVLPMMSLILTLTLTLTPTLTPSLTLTRCCA